MRGVGGEGMICKARDRCSFEPADGVDVHEALGGEQPKQKHAVRGRL